MRPLMFKPEMIPKIIDGSKVQTRRLVKEGEFGVCPANCNYTDDNLELVAKKTNGKVVYDEKKIKYKVGDTFAVTTGRGKPAIHYCPELPKKEWQEGEDCKVCHDSIYYCPYIQKRPALRPTLTAIRREKLFDITEEEGRKEGFNTKGYNHKWEFLKYFCRINKHKIPAKVKKNWDHWKELESGDFITCCPWNPEVWVLEFEVK